MLTCLPQSLCSWNFNINGASAGPAWTLLNSFSEQGILRLGGDEFTIVKHGPLSGEWTLEQNGQIFARALKPSAFTRSFNLETNSGTGFTLAAASPFGRNYEFRSEGNVIGTIRTAHPFTRRSMIDCDPRVPELARIFSFWLAVITWRRAANNNN